MLLLLVLLRVLERQLFLLLVKDDLQVVHFGSITLHSVAHSVLNFVHHVAEMLRLCMEISEHRPV